jgi:phospholipase/carboxylesterase
MSFNAVLHARPNQIVVDGTIGLHLLQAGGSRDSYFYVPPQYSPDVPAPLVLLLHGAGGHTHHGLDILRHLADETGLILAAPASTGRTWDAIVEKQFGTDVHLIDRSLEQIFTHYVVDTSHLAIGGFSDGASYALSLGIPNGILFSHVLAFSPGFVASTTANGYPRIFISHGIKDNVLPIDYCSRKIVPRLQASGYDLTYHEFDGGHAIPPEISQLGVDWLLQS